MFLNVFFSCVPFCTSLTPAPFFSSHIDFTSFCPFTLKSSPLLLLPCVIFFSHSLFLFSLLYSSLCLHSFTDDQNSTLMIKSIKVKCCAHICLFLGMSLFWRQQIRSHCTPSNSWYRWQNTAPRSAGSSKTKPILWRVACCCSFSTIGSGEQYAVYLFYDKCNQLFWTFYYAELGYIVVAYFRCLMSNALVSRTVLF